MSEPARENDSGIPEQGEILAGKYCVERVLGQGGMGVVVAAEHTALKKTVAIKLLLPDAMERKDSVERFLREGRSAMSIQSEHIARVHDFGTLESGQPFMVMEYLVGEDLEAMLKKRGPLPIMTAVDYVLQACEAIAEAHSRRIIHRDLKPANLFITQRPDGSAFVKVLDFGLSKPMKVDSLEPSLTAANAVMGSPYYMAPEQVRSLKHIDARADIWALGVILYQLTTAHRPFDQEALGSLFVMIGAEPPTPIREWMPNIPGDFEAVILKCLEKDPANRFQSVAELARALSPFSSDSTRPSIERILRMLADHAPLEVPARDSQAGPMPAVPVDASARTVTVPVGLLEQSTKPPSQESTPAMARSFADSGSAAAPGAGRPKRGEAARKGAYALIAAIVLAAGAVLVFVTMRGPSGSPAASSEGSSTMAEASETTAVATEAPPAPSVVPAPVTATSAETTSASAAASASATSSASAAPSTAPSIPPNLKKPWPSKTTKTVDPLDRR